MKKKLRVLSIDFDFFQNVDKRTLLDYPEGVDLSPEISTIVWGSKYVFPYDSRDRIKAVTVDQEKLNQLIDILDKQDENIPVLIAQSHVSIYDFIHENMRGKNSLSIVNIDLHHDIFNDNIELDCGNWINHIKKDFPDTTISWITREVSLDCYGIGYFDKIPFELNFDKITDAEFDIVFICRSDAWLPPHLDWHFDNLVKFCSVKFCNALAQNSILKIRDVSGIISEEEKLFEEMKKKGVIVDANCNTATE